ncbi:MAG: SurA N-terminal domain-containing protein [Gemmatimonadales bacterium]
MMQFFRSIAKPLVLVTAIAFFIWLVVDLSGLSGGGGGGLLTRTSVGKVNGTAIDIRAFQNAVQEATQQYQRRTGGSLGLAEQAAISDQVWEQAIQEIIFRAEYKRYGIRATDEEVTAAIRNSPPPEFMTDPEIAPLFQTDGQFDPAKYQAWLTSSQGQLYVPVLEERYREQIMRGKLFRRIVADVMVSDPALWDRYRDEKETVKVGVLTIDPAFALAAETISVTPQEVEEYYRTHKSDFEQERAAYVSYLALPREPDASDTTVARERALALRAEIAGGAPFAEVARRESADSVSAQQGGELGELQRSAVDSAFGAAAMSLPLRRLSEPVWSRFGFHLIEVESRRGDTFKARHILVPIEVTGAHRDLLDRRADSLEQLAADRLEPTALDTAGGVLGLPIERMGPVGDGAAPSIPGVGPVADVGVWAFQAKPGEHSPVIEAERAYVVFRLDSLQEEGVPPLDRIRPSVDARVRLEKQRVAARGLGEQLARETPTRAGSLQQYAARPGMSYREQGPFSRLGAPIPDPALIGAAFSAQPGSVAGPVDGADLRVYLLQVLERTPADSAEFAKELPQVRAQALRSAQQSRVQAYITALRGRAKVTDRRAEVFRTSAQAAAEAQVPLPQ